MRRWWWPAGGAVTLLGAGSLTLLSFRSSAHPALPAEVRVAGLRAPAMITLDRWGIPHVRAERAEDLLRALGFEHARQRGAQMELFRLAAHGRLAEALGDLAVPRDAAVQASSLLQQDRLHRMLGFRRTGEEWERSGTPEGVRLARAYCDGVNAARSLPRRDRPLELRLLGLEPGPWRPADCLAIGRLVAWGLSHAWSLDLIRHLLGERADALLPADGPAGATILAGVPRVAPPEGLRGGAGLPPQLAARLLALEAPPFLGAAGGSNAWVVSGARTKSGRPILANDPHLALLCPTLCFLVRLEGDGLDVAGATIPGLPALLVGRTPHVAWGVTDAYADTQDLFVETPAPGDPQSYLAGDRVERFQRVRERFVVRRLLRDRVVEWSWRVGRHGPVLNDLCPELGEGPLLALSWTGTGPAEDLLAFHGLLGARSADDVEAALDGLGAPTLSFVYATAEGDIGYRLAGRLPLRRGGDGRRPADGRSGAGDWIGFVPPAELPRARNPEAGFLVSANHAVAPEGRYPFVIGADPLAPHRAERIAERLRERDAWDGAGTARLQMDRFSRRAAGLVPLIVEAARDAAARDARARRAWERLRDWNLEADTDAVGPALFAETFRLARQFALEDEMPADVYARFSVELAADTKFDRLLADPRSPVWDARSTPDRRETRADVLAEAFLGAVAGLGERLGHDVDGWTWGRLSVFRFEHPFAHVPLAGALFRLREVPFPGLSDTVNPAYASPVRRHEVRAGATLRHVSDLGEPGVSRWVLPSGQSGRLGNGHFLDQAPLWLEGRLLTIGREPEGAEGRVRLVPLEGR